jgi:hypothetical protein
MTRFDVLRLTDREVVVSAVEEVGRRGAVVVVVEIP